MNIIPKTGHVYVSLRKIHKTKLVFMLDYNVALCIGYMNFVSINDTSHWGPTSYSWKEL